MSLFKNRSETKPQESKPVTTTDSVAPTVATRAREVPLPIDIFEGKDELLLLADLPGVEPEGLTVSFEAPELRIEGRRGSGETASVFTRTFRVSEQLDPNGISAELSAGVLTLHLAKAAHTKPRKIEVRAG
jgi:HSP20 family molecular chaperone IbpA